MSTFNGRLTKAFTYLGNDEALKTFCGRTDFVVLSELTVRGTLMYEIQFPLDENNYLTTFKYAAYADEIFQNVPVKHKKKKKKKRK